MNMRLFAFGIGISLSIGLGMGFGTGLGIAASNKPFVLEATDTPIGSFVFKGNLADIDVLPPSPTHQKEQLMWWHKFTA